MLRRVPIQVAAVAAACLLFYAPAVAQSELTLTATVQDTPIGKPLSAGFVGLSVEYDALHEYAGRRPASVNPVLVQLLRGLAPGQAPVLRVGGDSSDWTWWPVRGLKPRRGVTYALNRNWMRTTRALARDTHARLIMGVNLAAGRPELAGAEARALLRGVGRRSISAFEVGNEPDLYGVFPWYRTASGLGVLARSRAYNFGDYLHEFARWRRALPRFPLAGPALSSLTWMSGLNRFLSGEQAVRIVTVHRYPLHNSTTDQADPTYPSLPNLLADSASSGIAQEVAPYVSIAHARGLAFRVDEMNSVSGRGHRGISDTFAAALWVLDALFNMAQVGVDGVNVHTLPGTGYELFTFSHSGGTWRAFVHPEYYGMLMFAQAFPPSAQLLPVSAPGGLVKVWATRAPDGRTRVVVINKDPATAVAVRVAFPGAGTPAAVERLTAPSVEATSGVSLGGQSFGTSTTSGTLPAAQDETLYPLDGSYIVDLPAASAAMLTF